MFGLFKKKDKSPRPAYQVFSTEVNKYRHIIKLIKDDSSPVTVLYHFDNTKKEIQQLFTAAGIGFSSRKGEEKVWLTDVSQYVNNITNESNSVLVTEIYPLPDREINLMQKLDSTGAQFFSAVDSPFFKKLGGDRLPTLMQTLGMKDDEAIQHPMVSKSIARVQDKIQQEVSNPVHETESIEKWMDANDR